MTKTIGLVTGVFDLLHWEHVKLLHQAASAVNTLYVGVEPDVRVQQLKGQSRPFNSQILRKNRLAAILCSTAQVSILPEQFALPAAREQFLCEHTINRLVIPHYDARFVNKKQTIEVLGGELIIIDLNPAISSTKILQGKLDPAWLVFPADQKHLSTS